MSLRGVILYNAGTKCLVRLAITLHTLRDYWPGEVTIIAEPDEGAEGCKAIAKAYGAGVLKPRWKTEVPAGDNTVLLRKCLLHEVTPYAVSVLIDADCTVHGRIEPLFNAAEDRTFCVCRFSDWLVKGKIIKRIMRWEPHVPPIMLNRALRYDAAINTGVYGFTKDAPLMTDWFGYAKQNRSSYIPDETCCQVMLATYPHELMDARFNVSCKYGLKAHYDQAVIVHYHGRKHCRIEPNDGKNTRTKHLLTKSWNFLNGCERWWPVFQKIRHKPYVEPWVKSDRQLRHHLKHWKAARLELEGIA